MRVLDSIFATIAVVLFVIELLIEYLIKTLLFLPWYAIKGDNIYSYPPICFMRRMKCTKCLTRFTTWVRYMSIEQATYELVKENNMLLKAIYQKLLESKNNDFSQNVTANILANMLDGSYQRQRGKSI